MESRFKLNERFPLPDVAAKTIEAVQFQLLLTGEFGGRYSIEASTNLAPAAPAWEPLATLTNTFGSVQFNDPSPTNRLQRFYRAVEAP